MRDEVARIIAERAIGVHWDSLAPNRVEWRRRQRGTSVALPEVHQDELLDAADAILALLTPAVPSEGSVEPSSVGPETDHETADLKPCPFCGGRDIRLGHEELENESAWPRYECQDCLASTEHDIAAWNTRHASSKARDGAAHKSPTPNLPGEALVEAVADAIERAQCKGREGPYGGYDYSSYGWPQPYRVRDFRDPNSATWGETVFQSDDPNECDREFERLTRQHIARSAIQAYTRSKTEGAE